MSLFSVADLAIQARHRCYVCSQASKYIYTLDVARDGMHDNTNLYGHIA